MELIRHYFTSGDLDDLERVEQELVSAGITTPHIHILSRSNAAVHDHPDLNPVRSMMKRDIVHSTLMGALVGWLLAILSILLALFAGWTETTAGWAPFIFFAVILLGFCTWVGGMHGLRVPNYRFERFQKSLDEGNHVLFVDLEHSQENVLEKICEKHPNLQFSGTGQSMPEWIIWLEDRTKNWWYWRMWRNA